MRPSGLGLWVTATVVSGVLLGSVFSITGVTGMFAALLLPSLFLFAVAAAEFPIALLGAALAWLALCPFTWGLQTGFFFRMSADEAPIYLYLVVFPFLYCFTARVWQRGFGPLYVTAFLLVAAVALSLGPQVELVQYRTFLSIYVLGALLLVVASQEAANSNAEAIGRFVIWTTVGIAALSIVERVYERNPFLQSSPFAPLYVPPEVLRAGRAAYRPYVSFFTPSEAGTFMALGAPFVVRYWLRCRSWISTPAVLTVATGLFLNQTRGVWVGLLIAGLVASLALRRAWFWISASASVLAVGAWVGYQEFRTSPFVARLGDPKDLYDRLETWGIAVRLFMAHPLFGSGFGGFRRAYGVVRDNPFTADNMFVSTAVESGFVGLAAWIAFLAVALALLRRTRLGLSSRGLSAGASFVRCAELAVITYIAIGCFADVQEWAKVTRFIFIMVGLGVAEHVGHAAPVSAFSRTGEKVEEYAESRGASFPSR